MRYLLIQTPEPSPAQLEQGIELAFPGGCDVLAKDRRLALVRSDSTPFGCFFTSEYSVEVVPMRVPDWRKYDFETQEYPLNIRMGLEDLTCYRVVALKQDGLVYFVDNLFCPCCRGTLHLTRVTGTEGFVKVLETHFGGRALDVVPTVWDIQGPRKTMVYGAKTYQCETCQCAITGTFQDETWEYQAQVAIGWAGK